MARPLRVLVVDDDPVDRLACRRALERDPDGGFQVREAESAENGLGCLRREPPDCLVLDVNLPDAEAEELLERLDAEPAGRPPLVWISGCEPPAERAGRLREAGPLLEKAGLAGGIAAAIRAVLAPRTHPG